MSYVPLDTGNPEGIDLVIMRVLEELTDSLEFNHITHLRPSGMTL